MPVLRSSYYRFHKGIFPRCEHERNIELDFYMPCTSLPLVDPCAENNGGCSHLCLLSATEEDGFLCVCPDGVDPDECSGKNRTIPD